MCYEQGFKSFQVFYPTPMKYILRTLGFSLIGLAIVLSLYDFLLENKGGILLLGIVAVIAAQFIRD